MATPAHAQAVKSLNKSSGHRRFVFKNFSQRIEEIEINRHVLSDKIKSRPSDGSTFLRDCLVEWRELNTAEDFISFYEENLPFVQTLPLVLFHKESILSQLINRLHMKARLSLEPILRCIAALCRDLPYDFVSFLPRIIDSLVSLLKSGADREPEIIEQIFVAWSYILMYLQKCLVENRRVVDVLKITVKLRYYPKEYVQDFMAATTSLLPRNSSDEQLRKGIVKVMLEVVKKPSLERKYGVSALLFYVMRGTMSRTYSRPERVLQQLTGTKIFNIGIKFNQGSDTVDDVVTTTLQRLCEKLELEELNFMWNGLYQKIHYCITNDYLPSLSRFLSLLISIVQINNGRKVSNHRLMLECVGHLVQKFFMPYGFEEGEDLQLSEIIDKVLQLMLCTLDVIKSVNDVPAISYCSLQWAAVFKLRNSSCLTFINGLLEKDPCILYEFRDNIISAMNDLIETSQKDVVFMLLSFCESLRKDPLRSSFLDGSSEGRLSRIRDFLQQTVCFWIGVINNIADGNASSTLIEVSELTLLWGVIRCYPYMMDIPKTPLLMDLIDAIDRLLVVEAENIAGVPKHTWQSLVGASLSSYCKYGIKSGLEETSKVLCLAKAHKTSSHVLSAVADYLDHVHGPTLEADTNRKVCHPEFETKAADAFGLFADNLCDPDKGIRSPTLRILCHYRPQGCEISMNDQPPENTMIPEVSQTCLEDSHSSDVLQLLLLIETITPSISTSRKIVLVISRIQMEISAGRIPEAYIPILLSGTIGIFHNRFSYLWNAASECIAVLIGKHVALVWDKFVRYLEQCQSAFQMFHDKPGGSAEMSDQSSDLVERFNSFVTPASDNTPCATILSSLLQSLQKIPSVAESRSRQIIPLFLKFLGYNNNDLASVGSFNSDACKGKEWKHILNEWLSLLKLMRNSKAFYQSHFVKDVLRIRLIDEDDVQIQMAVLDCLLTWKDDFLLPYEQHLRNLISSNHLREELTTWSLSRESGFIEDGHRANLVPLVILLLMPKVRTLKTLASRKNVSLHHRKAILRFIAQLDVSEMTLFFASLLKPLKILPKGVDGAGSLFWNLHKGSVDEFHPLNILKHFTNEKIMTLTWKKRSGFLHVVEDILGVFDESHVTPFLDLLMGCVVRILSSCSSSLAAARIAESSVVENHSSTSMKLHEEDSAAINQPVVMFQTSTAVKQFKDLRSFCLKIISLVLNKYEDHDFSCEFWDLFFTSVKPLIDSFKQEGSSSEKPSSLFSCFLAMSRSHHLVPLLYREKNLVPDIFSILAVSTASEAIISCVLKFIENMLNLNNELDDEDNSLQRLLLPNLDELINSLHHLFQNDKATKRYSGETQIRIFKFLSEYIRDQLPARKLADILLASLAARSNDSDICLEYLLVVRNIIPVLGNESGLKVLTAVSPLLTSVGQDIRLSVCDLLDALAKTDPSILSLAKLLHELNATSAVEMGGLDYDTILNAYEKINAGFFYTVQEDHALAVLSHCVYDMSSDELILRHSAYRSLVSFVEFSAAILCGEDQNTDSDGCWTRACIHRIINKFLLRYIGNAMKKRSSVRKEWIDLLRDMVLKLPEVTKLSSFKVLCSEDAEQDFFNNIIHLQKHRRARALLRFKTAISKTIMSQGVLNKIFIPLFFNILFDVQGGKGEHIKSACLEALASISSRMEWKSYYALLNRCFREMNVNMDKQKILLRLIGSILDQFHFLEIFPSQEGTRSVDCILGSEASGCTGTVAVLDECDGSSSAKLQERGTSAMAAEIQACLHKTVLPKIRKFLDSDSDKVNVNISVAALKVLKLLPGDIIDSQLPSIIHRITNHLKSRLESIRDEARHALSACLKELGLEYLQFIVRVLRATLKRGYELHVLGYSLNFILSKFPSDAVCGKLDYCLEDLLSVVESDILGDVAEEKEVEKIASKMKETRKQKSFETLKIIAQSVTFKSHALKLISPVMTHMLKHPTPKLKTKLGSMLNHIAAGIECNPSADQTDLLVFIYGLIEDGIKGDIGDNESSSSIEANLRSRHDASRKTGPSGRRVGTKSVCSHLVTVFALGLFQNCIKSMRLDKNDEQLLSMLDPFIGLLGNCLNSKYEDVLSASLRCLTPLVRLPLPSLATQADQIKVVVLDIAQGSVNANSPLMQSCLRLLIALLWNTKMTLSSEQLHLLIEFPFFVDLERNPSFIALSLLKAIVNRKLVVPEIYDIAVRVSELMVTSQVESIRKKCSQILLKFLLHYRLSKKNLQQHLDFLLKNLSYEHSTGRETVLEMLHVIIIKCGKINIQEFSSQEGSRKDFLEKHGQSLFIHLVQCLANDSDNKVRSMTGAVIKLLVRRMSSDRLYSILDSIIHFSLSWYMDEKRHLQSLGAQATGLLVESMTKKVEVKNEAGEVIHEKFVFVNERFEKHVHSVLPVSRNILQSAVKVVTDISSLDPSDGAVPFWKEAYYSLVMLEKIVNHFHLLCFEWDLEDIWEAIIELLLHPHPWLRNICCRLIAFYFSAATKASKENHGKSMESFSLMRPSILYMIAVSLCCQLEAEIIDDSVSNLIMDNLVSAICAIHSLMGRRECIDPCKFWSSLEQNQQGQFLKAFQLLDSRKGRDMFLYVVSGVYHHDVGDQSRNLQYFLVSNLLKKMGEIALLKEAIQMTTVFNCFKEIASQINQYDCQHYAFDMLLPLYKVCEGFAGKVIPDNLKQLAQEVRESIRNALGIENFVQIYSKIRTNLKVKREKRKREEKLMAVTNPMRHAKRKLHIAAKNRSHKKRKIMSMKLGRWMR